MFNRELFIYLNFCFSFWQISDPSVRKWIFCNVAHKSFVHGVVIVLNVRIQYFFRHYFLYLELYANNILRSNTRGMSCGAPLKYAVPSLVTKPKVRNLCFPLTPLARSLLTSTDHRTPSLAFRSITAQQLTKRRSEQDFTRPYKTTSTWCRKSKRSFQSKTLTKNMEALVVGTAKNSLRDGEVITRESFD